MNRTSRLRFLLPCALLLLFALMIFFTFKDVMRLFN